MIEIIPYNPQFKTEWDSFVKSSLNGTFMHTQEFLEYHKNKFEDCSIIIKKDSKICSVFPAARINNKIISHPGMTVGGLIYNNFTRGSDILDILSLIKNYYSHSTIIYKTTPREFHLNSTSDDIWALFVLGAKKVSCEISNCYKKQDYISRTMNQFSNEKFDSSNIILSTIDFNDIDFLNVFWNKMVIPNLERYQTKPTHTANDIAVLYKKFPLNIKGSYVRHYSNKLLSGVIIFKFNNCYHAQYSVSTSKGRALNMLSFLHRYILNNLPSEIDIYNFGKSTEDYGYKLNTSLFNYKNKFSKESLVYETYEY